jgi:hypothetical protein
VVCLLAIVNAAYGHAEGVPVLIYHEILNTTEEPGETKISLNKFEKQMKYLYDNHYTTISIDELVSFMKGGAVPKKIDFAYI